MGILAAILAVLITVGGLRVYQAYAVRLAGRYLQAVNLQANRDGQVYPFPTGWEQSMLHSAEWTDLQEAIESHLRRIPGVADAAVLVVEREGRPDSLPPHALALLLGLLRLLGWRALL
ncbi:MAG TPA: hypothetical protein VIU62_10270 [Chloroflexota bacterium]